MIRKKTAKYRPELVRVRALRGRARCESLSRITAALTGRGLGVSMSSASNRFPCHTTHSAVQVSMVEPVYSGAHLNLNLVQKYVSERSNLLKP